ncbi:hypothetical protein [Enterococcus rivorum]|uniref:hypothetical protein n=1 Tax=Enterococcus rivorum TaxID=762845 RepID=UPI00363ECA3D
MDRWEAYVLETEYTFNPIDGMNYKNEDSTFEYDVQQIETYLNTMAHYLDSSEGKYLFELQNFRDNMSAEVLLKLSDFIDDRTDKYKKKIEYFSKEYGDQKELGILVDNLAKPFVIEKAQIGILLEEENRLKAETLSKSTDLERINEWIKSLKEANLVSGDELIIKGTVNGGYMDGKIVDLSIPIHSIELGTNENNEVGIQYSLTTMLTW